MFLYVAVITFSTAFADSDIVNSTKYSEDYVPCESGWYYFRDKCYTAELGKGFKGISQAQALAECREYGADLVSIQSQDEQDFISSLLVENEYAAWIGLSKNDEEADYKWSDGSIFNYTNWSPKNPGGVENEKDVCVYMYLNPIGTWNDIGCDRKCDYICKMNANPGVRSPNLMYCSRAEGGGRKYEQSCYHFVTEKMSWENAEKHCINNYRGHLLSILDAKENLFLQTLPNMKEEKWIGIKIEDRLQQKWTSGWYVSLEKFKKKENYAEGTCVARKNQNEWIKIPCSRQLPFICKFSKATPPILKPPPNGSYCPKEFDDWRDLDGDYCYYFRTEKEANFSEARSHCRGRGGDLLSIHSQEEADILHSFLKYTLDSYTKYWIYIGLIRRKTNTGEFFEWTDGSLFDYKDWDDNEPDNMEEECVSVSIFSMKWRDTLCNNRESGYICSVKKIMPNSIAVDENDGSSSHVSLQTLIGVCVCIHLVMCFLGVLL